MDGKTIVEGWGYDSERCPHTHIKQFPKLYCKLCMAAAIDAALAAARQESLEQAATIAESNGERGYGYKVIAAAIRARRP